MGRARSAAQWAQRARRNTGERDERAHAYGARKSAPERHGFVFLLERPETAAATRALSARRARLLGAVARPAHATPVPSALLPPRAARPATPAAPARRATRPPPAAAACGARARAGGGRAAAAMSMDNCSKLYRIRKTVHKMLEDRKYVVSRRELDRTKEEARKLRRMRSQAHACALAVRSRERRHSSKRTSETTPSGRT